MNVQDLLTTAAWLHQDAAGALDFKDELPAQIMAVTAGQLIVTKSLVR